MLILVIAERTEAETNDHKGGTDDGCFDECCIVIAASWVVTPSSIACIVTERSQCFQRSLRELAIWSRSVGTKQSICIICERTNNLRNKANSVTLLYTKKLSN